MLTMFRSCCEQNVFDTLEKQLVALRTFENTVTDAVELP
jgi:hypothetical protein